MAQCVWGDCSQAYMDGGDLSSAIDSSKVPWAVSSRDVYKAAVLPSENHALLP